MSDRTRVVSNENGIFVDEEIPEGAGNFEEIDRRTGFRLLDGVDVITQAGAGELSLAEVESLADDATTIDVSGTRSVLNLPGGRGGIVFSDPGERADFMDAIETLPESVASDISVGSIPEDPELQSAAEDRAERRDAREAARAAAEDAGVDLDEFSIDARADGEVVFQDRDTGRTRTIDADAGGGLGDAIDVETSGGEFVADAADPAAGATSGAGLGARAVAAIVLLLGAIAAAVGWSS